VPTNIAHPSDVTQPFLAGDKLRQFLNVYWLRPENAFWMTLRSEALAKCQTAGPALDVCCGDGLFSFIHYGGALDPYFDVFSATGQLDDVTHGHADMFDVASDDYAPHVVRQPEQKIDVGIDLKPALLAKAEALSFYKQLTPHNANEVLPFGDDSFQHVYCNAAYWIDNIDLFLRELKRITKPGGRVVLQVKLACMQGYTLEPFRDRLGGRFLEILGRGRLETWPTLADRSSWEQRFGQAGLCVEDICPFVTRTHAQIWDVGLRPIAPLLVKMANGIDPTSRASIKKDWVDLFCELLAPFCESSLDLFSEPSEPAEIQYVLRPAS